MVTYAGSSLTAPLGDAQLNKTTLSTLGYTRGSEVRVLRVEPGCQDRRNHIVQPSTRAETYRARIDVLFVCVCVAIALGFVPIALTRARWTAIYRKPFRNNLTHLANRSYFIPSKCRYFPIRASAGAAHPAGRGARVRDEPTTRGEAVGGCQQVAVGHRGAGPGGFAAGGAGAGRRGGGRRQATYDGAVICLQIIPGADRHARRRCICCSCSSMYEYAMAHYPPARRPLLLSERPLL